MRAVLGVAAFLASGALGLTIAFSQAPSGAPSGSAIAAPAATTGPAVTARTLGAYGALQGAAQDVPQAAATGTARPVQVAQAGMSGAVASSGTLPPPAAAPALNAPGLNPPAAAPSRAASGAATADATTTASTGGMMAPAAPSADEGRKYRPYTSANVDGPYIAITFDDGPNPETTPKLLKMLQDRGIKATFFVVGTRASESPELLRKMVAEGHEVGNHSWNHPQLTKIGTEAADKQVGDTSAAIETAIGKAPLYLRPPYGAMNNTLRHHIEDKYGLTFIYWSVDSLDWKKREAQSIYDKIMAQTHPGAIILAHDIHPTTVAAMPRVLDALLAKGYKFVTVSQLIAMNKPEPPRVASLNPAPAKPKKPKPANAAKPAGVTASSASGTKPPASVKPASSGTQQKRSPSPSSGLF